MCRMRTRNFSQPHALRVAATLIVLAACSLTFAACSSKPSQTPAAAATSSPGKHYAMKGKVLSVAKDEGSATVDANDIPGFMDAMAMPYPIPDQKVIANLSPGDDITADVVVTSDGKYHLENVVVTKKAA